MTRETAGQNTAELIGGCKQAITAGNITPTWAQYPIGGTSAIPNVMWQNTSSGATYCSASSVLKS